MTAHAQCPACGHQRFKALTRYRRAHLARCSRCRQVFAARCPTDSELAANYGQYPRQDVVSPITRQRYRELLEGFASYRRTNRILDFGCGVGSFLEQAQTAGWEAHGSEFEARAVEITRSKGLRCVQAPIAPEDFEPAAFDVITAFEVLEHLRDPEQEARLIARLLRPGGLFYCTTPNFSSLSRRVLGPRWAVIEYPEHLLYFTPTSLGRWLARHGFQAVRLTTSGLTMSRRWEGEKPAGLDQEQVREAIESSPALRAAKRYLNALLGAARAGDTIKGYFELTAPSPTLAAEEHLERQQRP